MMEVNVSIQTRAKNYDASKNEPKGKETLATSTNPLQIERPTSNLVLRPPKSSIKRVTHKTNA